MEANGKIPLTLGFADLSDNDFAALIAEDSTALSPLFERVRVAPARNIPSAEILFVYTHLNENGTIRGSDRSGIRQIAQLTKSVLVVVASPNSAANIKNAAGIPGPKMANIVFTADRNGQAFATFFHALFDNMRNGEKHALRLGGVGASRLYPNRRQSARGRALGRGGENCISQTQLDMD
jgi:hypothetical protein